jgi:hypothetical protein
MADAMILKCTCKHNYQDKTYGVNMRVHTPMATGKDTPPKFRCTVCRTERGK